MIRRLVLAGVLALGCQRTPTVSNAAAPSTAELPAPEPRDYEQLARDLYKDEPDYERRWPIEFRVRVLEGLMQDLQRAALDLGGQMGAPLFAPRVEQTWVGPAEETALVEGVRETKYRTLAPRAASADDMGKAWRDWISAFQYLERATFKLKDGALTDDGGYRSQVAVELAGRERAGGFRRDAGLAELSFAKVDGFWRITSFAFTELRMQRAAAKLFDEVTDGWLAGVAAPTRAFLRDHSASDELHRALLEAKSMPEALDHLLPLAMDAHPGVAVVDVNGDHFDDLFVWDADGDSVLLENQAGHGFADRTDHYGLRFHQVSAAAFGDLDNDGQLDVVVGRWFGRSELAFGAGGRFYPASASRFAPLPANVATVSLADIDGDGRLDIYFGTAAHDFHPHLALLLDGGDAARARLDPGELAQLDEALPAARAARAAGKLDINVYQFGPRNVVLLNRGGGRFVDGTRALGLELYRNTLQASFADVDGDGKLDLYVANDFAPANLYLQRDGKFVDVSAQSGVDQVFFGMGASFGDFDNDGDLDLYATAMQSTAGNRIMRDAHNFSPEHDLGARQARHEAARGNTLFRNDGGGRFTDLTAQPAFAVARSAQWSYSSQFIDVDGDGFLDVFAPNGFFTSSVSPDDPYVRDL
jgi:hypothetical protein